MKDLLKEYIRGVLREEGCKGKKTTLRAQNLGDIGQALYWGKLNDRIKNGAGGSEKDADGQHRVTVCHRGSKKDFKELIKARFGSFVSVE